MSVILKGFRSQRGVLFNNLPEFEPNEVGMVLKLDKNDQRDILDQSIEVTNLLQLSEFGSSSQ